MLRQSGTKGPRPRLPHTFTPTLHTVPDTPVAVALVFVTTNKNTKKNTKKKTNQSPNKDPNKNPIGKADDIDHLAAKFSS